MKYIHKYFDLTYWELLTNNKLRNLFKFFVDIDKYGLKTVLRNVFFITLFFAFLGYIEYSIDRLFNKAFSKHNK